MDLEPEGVWLRHRLRRLRAILRLVKEPAAEGILRELIADAEDLLNLLEKIQTEKLQGLNSTSRFCITRISA